MNIRIEHCTVCWGYRDRALLLAQALRKRFGAEVEVVGGTTGQFDVRVDGKLVFTRGENLIDRIKPPRLPDVSQVVVAIERGDFLPEGRVLAASSVRKRFGPEDAKRFYDRFGAWEDVQFYARAALKYLLAHADFEHATAVFEFGCGTGRFAACLLKGHVPQSARYVGIDISTTMVRLAKSRLTSWSARATVQEADGTTMLPYADRAFDRFVSTYVLDLFPESAIHGVLREARRLLRPEGKLCVVTSTEGVAPFARLVTSSWKRIYAVNPRLVGGCRPVQISTLLDRAAWKIERKHVVCSWGISSEIVIASPN